MVFSVVGSATTALVQKSQHSLGRELMELRRTEILIDLESVAIRHIFRGSNGRSSAQVAVQGRIGYRWHSYQPRGFELREPFYWTHNYTKPFLKMAAILGCSWDHASLHADPPRCKTEESIKRHQRYHPRTSRVRSQSRHH